MNIEQLQLLILALQVLVLPGVYAVARLLWNHDRRITRCELELGLDQQHQEA